MSRRFPIAPMSPLIRGLTLALWLLPVGFGFWALLSPDHMILTICLFLIGLYGAVWLSCRPLCFVIAADKLDIVFPIWRRKILLNTIAGAKILDRDAFDREFGWALRIGVGGLWGGFGWLWTQHRGLIEFYISRLDFFVLLDRQVGKSLLITPEALEQFVATIQDNRLM